MVSTHAAEVVHAQRQEAGVGEAVHEQLGVGRQAPDVGEVQHDAAAGGGVGSGGRGRGRGHVGGHVEDGLDTAARGSLVDRAEPAARPGGLGDVRIGAVVSGSGSHDVVCLVFFWCLVLFVLGVGGFDGCCERNSSSFDAGLISV